MRLKVFPLSIIMIAFLPSFGNAQICTTFLNTINDGPYFSNSFIGSNGGTECDVGNIGSNNSPSDNYYECKTQHPDYASADSVYQQLVSAFLNCFPSTHLGSSKIHTINGWQIMHANTDLFPSGANVEFSIDMTPNPTDQNYDVTWTVWP